MATAKKGSKSNKTAHVLNLLAPNGEKERESAEVRPEPAGDGGPQWLPENLSPLLGQ